jgi:hypothetical protein
MPKARRKRFNVTFEYTISVLADSIEEAEEVAYDELQHEVDGLSASDVCIVGVEEMGYNVSHRY